MQGAVLGLFGHSVSAREGDGSFVARCEVPHLGRTNQNKSMHLCAVRQTSTLVQWIAAGRVVEVNREDCNEEPVIQLDSLRIRFEGP